MPWVRSDDFFPEHRKVKHLSDAAFRLHVHAIHWSARHLTDGVVPAGELSDVAPQFSRVKLGRAVAELEQRGLWRPEPTGWVIHDYLDYQPSAEQVRAEREAKKKRQERWKAKQSGSRDASRDASGDAAPYPHPTRPAPEGRGGVGEGALTHGRNARERHPYADDGTGLCTTCELPALNRRHVIDGQAS